MKKIFAILFFVLIIDIPNLFAADRIYLNDGWEFRRVGDSVWYPATVPGTVHTDLYNNGLIPDPFYRDNEKSLQWIENEDWEYRCEFNISDSVCNQSNIDITFEGLDTYAKVYLNDSLIITADNMFRKWEANCKRFTRAGKNRLYILFESPIRKAKELKSGPELPGGDRVYTRKAAYQYGWDFGPRFVTSGIWKGVYIKAWDGLTIDFISYKTEVLSNDSALLNINVDFNHSPPDGIYVFQVWDTVENRILSIDTVNSFVHDSQHLYIYVRDIGHFTVTYQRVIRIENPRFWFCKEYGQPYLYHYKLILLKNNNIIDKKNFNVGFKKIELIQNPNGEECGFYFKLNNIPVFIKGSNFIPQNDFPSIVSESKYEKLIHDAVLSNINMLRVWGGGIYENEEFYNLCDENGILVWQDLMFANSIYNFDGGLRENVDEEVFENCLRITNHPSIAIYCGNNEIEEGWFNWGWQNGFNYTSKDSVKFWNEYVHFFNGYLASRMKGTGIPYIPTTPKIGWGHPEAMKEGDSHYWGVWWGMEPFEMYEKKIPRFMSEYGFQGFPDIKTIEQFTLPEDRYLYSPVMKAHQKHPTGYETIQTYMEREYKQPKDFESYVYVSQLLQAYGIKRAIEAHRRAKPYCMGTMYWQLDDCWPGVTWSGIDYYGRWKAMQYFVKEAYKDILVSVHEENDSVKVYIVSDRLDTVKGHLLLSLTKFDTPLNPPEGGKWSFGFDIKKFVTLQPNSSNIYFVISKNDLIQGHSVNDIALSARFIDDEGKEYKNLYYFVPPKELALENPEISYDLDNGALILSTKKLAKNVHIEINGVPKLEFENEEVNNLDNNYFDMLPGETVRLKIGNNINMNRIKVTSLFNTY